MGKVLFLVFMQILTTSSAGAVIYGEDNMQDIYEVPHLQSLAQAVAVMVPRDFLEDQGNHYFYNMPIEKMAGSSSVFACEDERFAEQPVIGNCTGFLIGSKYLITAGHCVTNTGVVNDKVHPSCEAFSWRFDYNMKSPTDFITPDWDKKDVYHCARIIRAEMIESLLSHSNMPGNDFAVIELDREVTGVEPLRWAAQEARPGDSVYTIGHSVGLPAKYSGAAPVLTMPLPHFFDVNLDTFGGNSGGPVFNDQQEVVGILVRGYQNDQVQRPEGCYMFNRCDDDGQNCDNPSDLESVSNSIQQISTAVRYLPTVGS